MKQTILILLSILAFLSSCKKDGELRDIPVTSITLGENTASLIIGQTMSLQASVLPENATNKAIIWKSSDEKVATVDDKGIVKGVALGVADITATSGTITTKCEVSVEPDNYLREGVLNLYVEAPGSLSALVERIAQGQSFDTFRAHGKLNGDDLETITTMVSVKELDLADAAIVSGGTYNLRDNQFGKKDETYYNNVARKYQALTALEKLILPNSLKKIEYRAFYGSTLKDVVFPDGLDSIGDGAFERCRSLESLVLPENLKYIGLSAFDKCENIKGEVIIPGGVKVIASGAFNNCSSLEKVVFAEGVEQLGTDETSSEWRFGVFENCGNLKSITLPSTMKRMNPSTFFNCQSLAGEIVIPEGITELNEQLFQGAMGVTKITLPSKLQKIGASALYYTATDLSVPATVTSLGDYAFYHDELPVTIHFKSAEPAEIGYDFINSMFASDNTIYVPKGSLQKYKDATFDSWGMEIGYEMFGKLVEEQ